MENCIFCKIANKEIPNYTVREDEHSLAFLDINPHAKGHTVVIPKQHAETTLGMSEEEFAKFAVSVKRTVEVVNKVLAPDGFNVGWNHGVSGGQAVFHLHVHILPRYGGDGGGSMHSIVDNAGTTPVEKVAKLFQS